MNTLNQLRRLSIATLMGVALVLGTQPSANALSIKIIQDGGSTFTCADGAVCDTNTSAGVVTMTDPFAGTLSAVVVGTGDPILGSKSLPDIDLAGVLTTSDAGGTFRFLVSDTGFTGPVGSQLFDFHIGGTRRGPVSSNLYLDSTNTLFGTQQTIATFAFPTPPSTGSQSFSSDTQGSATSGTPYSLTIETVITHAPGTSRVTSFDAEAHALAPIPEPSSLLLLGSGLVGLGWLKRKRNS